jgi:plastocyanin
VVGGSEKLIELRAAAAGTYLYTCEIAGHEDMKGTLEVSG